MNPIAAVSVPLHGATWSLSVATWMFLCVAIGVLLWRRSVSDVSVARSKYVVRWGDAEENPALVVIVMASALCSWLAASAMFTGDEAANIEPHFWSQWYMAWESRSSPPLFRAIIHLLEPFSNRLMMRLPALSAGIASMWLLYKMLRRRVSAEVAAPMLIAVCGSASLLAYSSEQKSYTCWLFLLLACHRCLTSAVQGRRGMWPWFVLWSSLALLTHYLSVAWLFGYVLWAAWRSREDFKDIVLALLPGALAVMPMIWPILTVEQQAGGSFGEGRLGAWLQSALLAAFIPGGGLCATLLLILRPVEHPRGRRLADEALSWCITCGVATAAVVALSGRLEARFLMPLLPMSLLATAGRMPRPVRDWGRNDRLMLGLVAVISVIGGLAHVGPIALTDSSNPVQSALRGVQDMPKPTLRLVQPPWALHVVVMEATGQKTLLHDAKGDGLFRRKVTIDGVSWATLDKPATNNQLQRVLRSHGAFELWSLAGPALTEPLATRSASSGGVCDRVVQIGRADRTLPAPWTHVWRCHPMSSKKPVAGQRPSAIGR